MLQTITNVTNLVLCHKGKLKEYCTVLIPAWLKYLTESRDQTNKGL